MIDNLIRASLEGAVMVAGIWVLTRALPLLSPAVNATLWWCAAAKFIITVFWAAPLVLPILPAPAPVAVEQLASPAIGARAGDRFVGDAAAAPAASRWRIAQPVNWASAALALWAIGLGVSTAIGFHRWRRIRTAIARSTPADGPVSSSAGKIGELLSLRHAPEVRMSDEIESPLITGLLRPVVLLPAARFAQMPPEQQRMALCHELAHMKRGDVWLGCVPAAAERIFFFHPLVRLAAREYIFWREAACDAAVLRALGAAPQAYGRLLLDLGVTRPQPALAAAGAAWSFSNLKRRIVMLQQPPTPRLGARLVAGTVIAITFATIAPLRLGARDAVLPPVAPLSTWLPAPAMLVPVLQPIAQMPVASEDPQETRPEPRQRAESRFVFLSDETTTMSGNLGTWSEHGASGRVVRRSCGSCATEKNTSYGIRRSCSSSRSSGNQ